MFNERYPECTFCPNVESQGVKIAIWLKLRPKANFSIKKGTPGYENTSNIKKFLYDFTIKIFTGKHNLGIRPHFLSLLFYYKNSSFLVFLIMKF